MMGQRNRLGALQMGVAREDDIRVLLGLSQKREHEPGEVSLMP